MIKTIKIILGLCLIFSVNSYAGTRYYAGTGEDGVVEYWAILGDWDASHDGDPGTFIDVTGENIFALTQDDDPSVTIGRCFLPFDTSGIDDDAVILSASLFVYSISKTNEDNDGNDWVNVVQTSQN